MAPQVSFSREDYEHAIARIFFQNQETGQKSVVGTGFLVAPGYVLTCAHVVLQALGLTEEEFANHQEAPKGTITLDFFSDKYDITAKVVAWEAYNLEEGDIAALKLQALPPKQAKPMLLRQYACEDIRNQPHYVMGFASDSSNPTEAYRPKANAPGGRFQFHKEGDPQGDTIESGFSGAPVLNETHNCIVGMVATAWIPNAKSDMRCRAYVIPEVQLRPVLHNLFARSLCDLVEQARVESRSSVQNAVELAFALCEEGRVEGTSLLERLQYLTELSNRGWQQAERDVDRLTQFAVFLAVMDGLPKSLRQGLEDWVRFRQFAFEPLYVKANQARQDRQLPSSYTPEHLIVQIKPDEQNAANVKIWLWVIGNRELYDPLEPPPPRLKDKVIPFVELPLFLESWLEAESALENPMMHCFVARRLLGCDLDARETQDGLTLGNQYRLVMRTDLSQSPTGKQHYARWQQKWEDLEQEHQTSVRDVLVRSDCSKKGRLLKQLRSAEMAILENLTSDRVEEIFEFLAKKVGLPVALWSRQDAQCQDLEHLLDCAVINLPERVFEERSETLDCENKTHVGYHLSLVWEDFKVIPPTWEPFDQEAC
ncbi:MAG: trypsin-like peptidase domain-containing protein [Leptolyngbya sp. SIO4C1]|nr:trypsin-like peptidase domain-containing protein [Leptolyngbya sp. SIO4C1]